MNKNQEKWALFWCGLLNPIIFEEVEKNAINQFLITLNRKDHVLPNGKRKKISLSTLRRKYNIYVAGGFANLIRKKRNDIGKSRARSDEIMAKAIELKKEQPIRSDIVINHFLKDTFGKTVPRSSLYRHLKQAGATKIKLGVSKLKVRKRWSRDHTHDLWVGDFEEGPYVIVDGNVVPTYLCLWIDCHSRYIVEARYYLKQTLDVLIDSLLRAWAVHGKSKQIYVDRAKIYISNAFKAACCSLGIKHSNRPSGDPAAGGVVERFFETLQSQFEAEVRAGDILYLDALNRGLCAYLMVGYHQNMHSETRQTPQQRYHSGLGIIRPVDMQEAIKFFMEEEKRTVHKDFSDIQLKTSFYKVDKKFRGDKVLIRYDPYSDMQKIWMYSLKDEVYLGEGILHAREHTSTEENDPANPARPKPKHNYIDLLIKNHEKQLKSQSSGIDYRKVISRRPWPFASFIQKLAKLMGRKTTLSSFTAQELEILKKTYNRSVNINEQRLQKAWEQTKTKTIADLIYQLHQILLKSKEEN